MLRSYRFDKYRTGKEDEDNGQEEVQKLTFHLAEPAAAEAAWAPAAAVVQGVQEARDLVSEPANVLSPEAFAEACTDAWPAARHGGRRARSARRCASFGMNALLAVGQGSQRESRVAALRWNGGAPDQPPIA